MPREKERPTEAGGRGREERAERKRAGERERQATRVKEERSERFESKRGR